MPRWEDYCLWLKSSGRDVAPLPANPTLCRLVAAPLDAAAASLQRLAGPVRSGQVSGSDLDQVNDSIDQA